MKINALKKELDGVLPGLAVSILISLVSQFLARFLPTLGAALIAILLGMLLGNTLLNRPELSQGTKFSEKRLLEYAIVLNGLILDFQVLKSAGLKGFVFIILQMSLTIFVTYQSRQILRLRQTLRAPDGRRQRSLRLLCHRNRFADRPGRQQGQRHLDHDRQPDRNRADDPAATFWAPFCTAATRCAPPP